MSKHLNTVSPSLPGVGKPGSWDEYLAHWISQLGSPPVVTLVAVVLTAAVLQVSALWIALHLLLTIGLPVGYIVSLVRQGKVTDLDLQLREQRARPFLVTMGGQTVAWALLSAGGAPYPLPLLAVTALVQTFCIFVITLHWKISVHTSTAAGIAVLLWRVMGSGAGLPLAASLPFIAWSRVKLRRHTPLQVLAGAGLGSAIFLSALLLAPLP